MGQLSTADLGPFVATYTVDVEPTSLEWSVDLIFEMDLNVILPDFRLPEVAFDIPGVGQVTTPSIRIDWPTVAVPVSFTGVAGTDAPEHELRCASASMLGTIALAVTPVLLRVPFSGPVLGVAIDVILSVVGIGGVAGFLGPVVTPLVSKTTSPIHEQPELLAISA